MFTPLRIATFNLENLDDQPGEKPSLVDRIAVMRPQLLRLDADIICLQEVNGQETNQQRQLLALNRLLEQTPYHAFHQASTNAQTGQVYDKRNLVILSRFEILAAEQYKHQFTPTLMYRSVTAIPPEPIAKEISWERPFLYAKINLPGNQTLHIINVHLKSKLPSSIAGQRINEYVWKTAAGWAEGSFVSAMKRLGQALEVRLLIDQLLDADENAHILVCGDFNADMDEVPVEAIRGDVENTGNPQLSSRVMVACERSLPASARYSLFHQGQGRMLDHILISRSLLAHYRSLEIHNELLHDESLASATDKLYPEPDHAPVIAEFVFPNVT